MMQTEPSVPPSGRAEQETTARVRSETLRHQAELVQMAADLQRMGARLEEIVRRALVVRPVLHTGLKNKVTELIAANGPLSKSDIIARLHAEGFPYSRNGLGTLLTTEFTRVDGGVGHGAVWGFREP